MAEHFFVPGAECGGLLARGEVKLLRGGVERLDAGFTIDAGQSGWGGKGPVKKGYEGWAEGRERGALWSGQSVPSRVLELPMKGNLHVKLLEDGVVDMRKNETLIFEHTGEDVAHASINTRSFVLERAYEGENGRVMWMRWFRDISPRPRS